MRWRRPSGPALVGGWRNQSLWSPSETWLTADVEDESDALHLRIAMAEAGHRRRVLAIGAKVPGWPTLDPTPATWALVDQVDPPLTGPRLLEVGAEPDAWVSRPVTEDGMRRALCGNGPVRDLRRALARDELKRVRRAFYKDARRALGEGDTRYFDHVAAWADRAHSVFDAALSAPRLAAAPEHDDTAHTLGVVLTAAGRFDEAITLLRAAHAGRATREGADHWSTRATAKALARALRTAGRFDEAERTRGLARRRRLALAHATGASAREAWLAVGGSPLRPPVLGVAHGFCPSKG